MFDACYVNGAGDVSVAEKTLDYDDTEEVLVKIVRGGICGSDIHYYQHGGIGDFSLQHPMVLGHEVIGEMVTDDDRNGRKVAVNPSRPCNRCEFCLDGQSNQCVDMRFFGSAMLNPHVDGGFSQYVAVRPSQCIPYDPQAPEEVMAFSEPLAVAINAINRAGSLLGKTVLVTGAGPIGCLLVAACRAAGAAEIVATDLVAKNRQLALRMGADAAFDPAADDLSGYCSGKGYFHVSFEASGAIPAIQKNIEMTRARGTMVQVGMRPGMVDIPLTKFLAKEIRLVGAFRFTDEYTTAVRWLEKGIVDPRPLLTRVFPYAEIEQALELAADKNRALKVQLSFS
jgi:L-idonate 5-dehydrogenase